MDPEYFKNCLLHACYLLRHRRRAESRVLLTLLAGPELPAARPVFSAGSKPTEADSGK
jgi:hypothetical protein